MSQNNILIRGANWVGDAVMTLPALTALASHFSQNEGARVTVLTRPWAAPVYAQAPLVSAVMHNDQAGVHRGLWGRLRLARELAGKKFDCAILFQNAFEAALVTALARIPKRAGFARDGRGFLLTYPVKLNESDRHIHESFYYLALLERLGIKAPFSRPKILPQAQALAEADVILKEGRAKGFILALAPGAAFGQAKRWPAENFARAAEMILAQNPGCAVILGGAGEAEVAARLEGLLGRASHINLAGRTSMNVSIAILSRANFLLTNDSGLMHLGGALNVPLAALFGPTNPLNTAPLGQSRLLRSAAPCSPCLLRECPLPGGQICFNDLNPELAASAACDLISPPAGAAGARPAVFLDRDGTINRERGHLSSPGQLELIPGAARAIAALNRAGWPVIITSNQSGVARGYFTETDVEAVHLRLRELLAKEGATLDAIYYCPHHPQGSRQDLAINCDCRKPGPGLAVRAARDLNIDLARSIWIGDRRRDLAAANKFGGRSVLVMTGYGPKEAALKTSPPPTLSAPDLARAAEWILNIFSL